MLKPIIQAIEKDGHWCMRVNYETWTLHLTVRGAENEGNVTDESGAEDASGGDE